ncbi:MAG TPA: NAD(+) diphosphatase [Steroidobacteraceae bacterium]|jgi:NAD+ diphosphatase|nr:NAD(+) diphosphatase [Steroidobacteraceae bacterium]
MPHRNPPNFFAGPYIDRRSEVREDTAVLAAIRADPRTRYLLSLGGQQLLHAADRGPARIAFLGAEHPIVRRADETTVVLLGQFQDAWCILIDLPAGTALTLPEATQLAELRPLAALLPAPESALLAYARGISLWRARQRFCGVCGQPTRPTRGGHVLRCTHPQTPHEFFPRLDPAIIVLVTDGDRALLGRQASWPAGRYSTIAGFVEPGESLEDAVAREVREETGVDVEEVDYQSSQPWPFPASLMLGFRATAGAQREIHRGSELADAQWFARADLLAGGVLLPPPHAIAGRLIGAWLEEF